MVNGLDLGHSTMNIACKGCIYGKQYKKLISSGVAIRANHLLELLHLNVCRPTKKPSLRRARYFITFIDDFSKKV